MISDALLIAQVNGEPEDLTTLRRLEIAAIETIQVRTGRYYGTVAAITEYLNWRGWPMQLANVPISLTTFKSWDGSAWSAVASTSYYLQGSFIYWNSRNIPAWSPLTMPTRYEAVYQAGYTVSADPLVWPAPADVQQAVCLLVGHWFRNREGEYTEEVERALTSILSGRTKVAI